MLGEPQTGAMIALVPAQADTQALSVDPDGEHGGEMPQELHVTLAFLGKAADIAESAKLTLTEQVQQMATQIQAFDARVFAVNIFNPNGDEPCLVLGIGGNELDPIHDRVCDLVDSPLPGFTKPDNHAPWIPHMTLQYFQDGVIDYGLVQKVAANIPDSVRIDRIRLAFADQALDFPLTGTNEPVPEETTDMETKPTSSYEKTLSRINELKVVRHVRTPEGQRRYKAPIGSVIVGNGHKLPHLKEVESDFHGYNKYDIGNGRSVYTRKVGGKYTAFDESDNIIASDASEDKLLDALDKVAGAAKEPAPKHSAPYSNLTRETSDYEGYEKFSAPDGTAVYRDVTTNHYYDENDNELSDIDLAKLNESKPGTGKKITVSVPTGSSVSPTARRKANRMNTASEHPHLKQVTSDYDGYDKYQAPDGSAVYQDHSDGKYYDANDKELSAADIKKLGGVVEDNKSNVTFEVGKSKGSGIGYQITRHETTEDGRKIATLVGYFSKQQDAEARVERLKEMEKESPGSSDPKHPDYKPHILGTDPRTGKQIVRGKKPVPKQKPSAKPEENGKRPWWQLDSSDLAKRIDKDNEDRVHKAVQDASVMSGSSIIRRERDKNGNWKETTVSESTYTGDRHERAAQHSGERDKFLKLVASERTKAGVGNYKPWQVPSQKRRDPKTLKTTGKSLPMMYQVKAPVITPGGRVGDNARHGSSANGRNWVERSKIGGGALPEYIRIVRNGLMKHGHDEASATALAVAAMKKWARGGGHVTPKVRAAAAAALAQWEAMKGEAHAKSIHERIAGIIVKAQSVAQIEAEVDSQDRLEQRRRNSDSRKRTGHNEDRSWNQGKGKGNGKWDESKHPRKGGKFAPKGSGSSSSSSSSSRGDRGDNGVGNDVDNHKWKDVPDSWKKRLPIQYGAQGSSIQSLQNVLAAVPGIPSTEQDGIYGDKTKAAVAAFQKQQGLKATGVMDEDTFAALINYAPGAKSRSKNRNKKTTTTHRRRKASTKS